MIGLRRSVQPFGRRAHDEARCLQFSFADTDFHIFYKIFK